MQKRNPIWEKELSRIPTQELTAELEKRQKSAEYKEIKKLISKENLVCGVEWEIVKNNPNHYILGIIKDGKFKDFYYNSGLSFDIWPYLIPSQFRECMESTYEFRGSMKEALDILKKSGYTYFQEYKQ